MTERLNDVRWRDNFTGYEALVSDAYRDADYLRRTGLIPNIVELAGRVERSRVLDAGCGGGWLFDTIAPGEGWECDLITPARRGGRIHSERQDVRALTYPGAFFDVVVSSLVLMWVDDLQAALDEAFRVTREGGRLVVGLTHPYFHNMGHVLDDGSFVIERCLAVESVHNDVMIGGEVGPFTYYYRPLVQYYNAALAARWRLTGFRDYSINMERYLREASGRSTSRRRTGKVPLFTFFVCEK